MLETVAKIVLGVDSPQLADELVDFLDRSGRARVVATAASAGELAAAVRDHRPNAVVGVPRMVRAAGGLNGSRFLALDTSESLASLRGALDAGAHGFFLWPSERAALADAAASSAPPHERPASRAGAVVSVYGPRGGAGVTFVSTHLAAAFAERGTRTTLVDLDPGFADLTVALGVPVGEQPRSVADLRPVAHELTEEHLGEVLWGHPAGFDVLLAPPRPGPAASMMGPVYRAVVPALAATRQAVVLHLPRALDETTSAALQASSRIVVVLTLDVLAFRACRRSLDAMAGLGVGDRVVIVVNRARRAELTPRDVARAFGAAPRVVIPSDRAVGRAQDRGRLLRGRRAARRAVDRLARSLIVEAAR